MKLHLTQLYYALGNLLNRRNKHIGNITATKLCHIAMTLNSSAASAIPPTTLEFFASLEYIDIENGQKTPICLTIFQSIRICHWKRLSSSDCRRTIFKISQSFYDGLQLHLSFDTCHISNFLNLIKEQTNAWIDSELKCFIFNYQNDYKANPIQN